MSYKKGDPVFVEHERGMLPAIVVEDKGNTIVVSYPMSQNQEDSVSASIVKPR